MSLSILFPTEESEVYQTFLANGTYEYPNDLNAVLVALFPKLLLAFGERRAMPGNQWGFVFRNLKPGHYKLIVGDGVRFIAKHVDILVLKVRATVPVKLMVMTPGPGTDPKPHTQVGSAGFPAQGIAVSGAAVAGQMIANNGAGANIGDGVVVEAPSALNNWFWQLQFGALPAQASCRFSAQSGTSARNNDFIDIVDSVRPAQKKKPPTKGKK